MYVCMFHVYKCTRTRSTPSCPTYTHAHTRTRLRKTEEYFGFKKKKGKKRGEEPRKWSSPGGDVGSCETRPDYIFPKRDTPLSRASISRNEGHTFSFLAHIAFARATTDAYIDFYTHARTPPHTHTHTRSRVFDDSETPCIDARSRARVNREIITLRGAKNARV